ncbi:ABC transporter substrate-binding protein [Nocardioides sp.]|uniref:ABC transporter substrate-binding protein n=1 Tax=Nocardioides sp. TaxID=35761 RepID=UPI002C6481E2|nr:ABC transporter substrate-binding protein [Nocardioides sp.]HXH79329.1 ABC transporter substrate-binding protein [Nocardioides sp.]
MNPELKVPAPTLTPPVRLGALVPLTRPGWVMAGAHLLAGMQLAVEEANESGGLQGRPVELLIRDTAANPDRAVAVVDELAELGVVALAGEYHSVVAQAVATRSDALGMPYMCSSAVLDSLVERPSPWVARLAPPQSRGWAVYAEYLASTGHEIVAVAIQPSPYWAAGVKILEDQLGKAGISLHMIEADAAGPAAVCDEVVDLNATALLLLVGNPDPAVSIVRSVRCDERLAQIVIGAPAGQPEFPDWAATLGADSAAIPFLRYLPGSLSPHGSRVQAELRRRLACAPSFVALEAYDTVNVLLDALRKTSSGGTRLGPRWPDTVEVEGTRGPIRFSQSADQNVWQWTTAPVQISDRDPKDFARFRVLYD